MDSIYLFSGLEELIIQNKIDMVITESHADAFNICTYDCEEVDVYKAVNELITPPFLGNKKVVIVKNPIFLTKNKSQIEHNVASLMRYLDNPAPFSTLIINAYGISLDEKLEITKKLEKVATQNVTQKLSRVEIEGWLKRQLSLMGYVIEDDAVRAFFERIGENLVNAKTELEKLICYLGTRRYVTMDDITSSVIKEVETDVFALTRAIIAKKKDQTISIYQDLIKSGKNPYDLFGLISSQLNSLLVVSKLLEQKMSVEKIASSMGLNLYRVGHLVEDAKKFEKKEIENNILAFHNLDYKIKTGQIDPQMGIEFLILGL